MAATTVGVRNLFRSGFTEFRHTGALADVVVIVEGTRYRLHRLILSFSSDFFAAIFKSDFKENTTREVHIKFPDPKNVFPTVLKYIYGGRVSITSQNAIPLLQQAEQLLIPSLGQQCRDFIKSHLNSKTAYDILLDALEFQQDSIVDWCLKILAATFLRQAEHLEWHKLETDTFIRLLSHERFNPSDEWQAYSVVCKYVDANADDLTAQQIQSIMSSVRYRWLSYKQLQEVVSNPAVPRDLIIDALMGRLQTYESGVVPKASDMPQYLRKRPVCGAMFEYFLPEAATDPAQVAASVAQPQAAGVVPKGIVHWIASTFGRSTWKNPVSSGAMNATASSLERGSVSNLLDENALELWTQNVPASYFCVDFLRYRVTPVAYALRHGHNHKRDYLRNWDFQGSNDGKLWTTLRRHSNDDSLSGPFDVKVFSLLTPPAIPYQYFRIIQTGHNSSGNNFLVLSGFEVFGELWDVPSSDDAVQAVQATLSSSVGPYQNIIVPSQSIAPTVLQQPNLQQQPHAPTTSSSSSSSTI